VFRCARCAAVYDSHTQFCVCCQSIGTLVPNYHRAADEILGGQEGSTILSALELSKRAEGGTEAFGIRWGGFNVVYGPPGGGKTILMLKVIESLPKPGLYIALEEGLGDTLASKLRYLEIRSEDLYFAAPGSVKEINSIISEHHPGAMCIDSVSVSTMTASDLLQIARNNDVIVIASLQVTKEGIAAGSMSFLHLSDVVIRVENLEYSIEKSRFQGKGGGKILNA